MPLVFGIVALVIGFGVMKLILNVQRLAPGRGEQKTAQASPTASVASALNAAPSSAAPAKVVAASSAAPAASPVRTAAPAAFAPASTMPSEPEVRRAKPVSREELAKAPEPANSPSAESGEQNRVAIRPLKRTYVRVTVGDQNGNPAFERWVSPSDGPVEFRGKRISIRVLDPEAVKITKDGKSLEQGDQDVTVN
jgi:hypothetical protein